MAVRSRPVPKVVAGAVALAVILALSGCDVLPPAPPGGETASCNDIAWGSADKSADRMTVSPITGARAGRHNCYDRLVIDLRSAPAAGWNVGYRTVSEPGTGDPVPVRGTDLEIVIRAPSHDTAGNPTYDPANPSEAVAVGGFSTFRQVVFVGTFEGQTTFGLGTRARLPFRVFALEGSRGASLVVDVAHRWS